MLLTISAPSQEKESPEAEAGKHAARARRARAPRPPRQRPGETSPAGPRPALLSGREQNHLRAQLLIEKPAFLTQGCRHLLASRGFPPGGAHLARIRKSNNGGGVSFLCTYLSSGCRIHFQNCFQWASSQLAVARTDYSQLFKKHTLYTIFPRSETWGEEKFWKTSAVTPHPAAEAQKSWGVCQVQVLITRGHGYMCL